VGAWKGFTGLDMDEDIIHSLFLGAQWSEIPEDRVDERSESEIHYPLTNSHKISVPIYAVTRSDLLITQSLYSSLMTFDKYGLVHPNLAKSYIHELIDGTSVWTFNLRDDVLWSDGVSLTAIDVKFTLDMNTFPWIASANSDRWRNLESVDIINDTSIKIVFDHQTLDEIEILSNEFIIPNHILNTTFTMENGVESTPYTGGNPGNSPEWSAYINDPVTAGPYTVVDFVDSLVLTLVDNTNYWYPSEVDFDHSFNLDNQYKEDPYYFVFEDDLGTVEVEKVSSLPIDKIVFHVSDAATIDPNSAALLFESGVRDFHEYPKLDTDSSVLSSDKLSIYSKGVPGSGLQLIINPKFEALSEYEIRKALSLAIDRPTVEDFVGFAQFAQATPISRYYADFYDSSAATPYDYEMAKNLFRKHGLTALDTNAPVSYTAPAPWDEIPISFISVLLAVPVVGLINRYRKNKWN
jgi:ABC-type transport system substrate-binding protein